MTHHFFTRDEATSLSPRNTVASSKDKRGIVIDLKQPVEEKRDLEEEKNEGVLGIMAHRN